MLPILFEFPFFRLKSLTLLAFLALFFSAFVFWRKGREEHYDTFEIFDAFLLSGIFGFLMGRLFFVVFHFSQFSQNIFSVLNIVKNALEVSKQGDKVKVILDCNNDDDSISIKMVHWH